MQTAKDDTKEPRQNTETRELFLTASTNDLPADGLLALPGKETDDYASGEEEQEAANTGRS